jgi:hypothetical protein
MRLNSCRARKRRTALTRNISHVPGVPSWLWNLGPLLPNLSYSILSMSLAGTDGVQHCHCESDSSPHTKCLLMRCVTQIAQVILLALTLSITLLRCFVRLRIEARALTLSDYLVWIGCLFTVAFVVCQGIALNAARTHPLVDDTYTDSVVYLKVCLV